MKVWRAVVAVVGAALLHGSAAAHTRSESLATWTVQGAEVRASLTVPEVEALRLAATPPSDAEVAAYLVQHLGASVGDQPCTPLGTPLTPPASRGFRRVELQWRCAAAAGITLQSSAFYELAPTHVMLARVKVGDSFSEQLLTSEHRSIVLAGAGHSRHAAPEPAAARQAPQGGSREVAEPHSLESASFLDYVAMGLAHIVTGPDHIAFLLGLVLISRRFRDLALVVTGFTLGHSATLALAVTGWLRPAPALIDVMIALTIGLVGAENMVVAARRAGTIALATGALLLAMALARLAGLGRLPTGLLLGAALFAPCYLLLASRLVDAAPLRALVTSVFGLIHGFAFANDLIELELPTGRLAGLLFGFNIGVEIGQLLIVAALLGAAALLVRLKLALPRPPVVEATSAALVGLSLFWIVGRTYAP
jgi:hypothetical protein